MLPRRSNETTIAQTKAADATTDRILETEGAKTTATKVVTKAAQIGMVATATNRATIAPVIIKACSKRQSPLFGNLKSDPVNHTL